MPAPMPFDAPVTTATLPASFPIFPVLFRSALTGRPGSVTPIVRKYGTVEQRFKGLYLHFVMRPLLHPSVEDIRPEAILHALADPERAAIFAGIAGADCVQRCSQMADAGDRVIPKSSLS